MKAPLSDDEAERLQNLPKYQILDTACEKEFDNVVRLAASICGTPIALVNLIDSHRQWLTPKLGLNAVEISRQVAFCSQTILQPNILIIPDALADERFADNPLVNAAPALRFYAGVPLITPKAQVLGTLCVIDYVPRELTSEQIAGLRILSQKVMQRLQKRDPAVTFPSSVKPPTRGKQGRRIAASFGLASVILAAVSLVSWQTPQGERQTDPVLTAYSAHTSGKIKRADNFPPENYGRDVPQTLAHSNHQLEIADNQLSIERSPSTAVNAQNLTLTISSGILLNIVILASLYYWMNREQVKRQQIKSALKQAEIEESLRHSEQRFRFLIAAIPQQVWTAQPDGAVDYVNQRILDYFGCTYAEMLGSGWRKFIHPDDLPQCIERWTQSLETGEVYENEFRLLSAADGNYRWFLGRALPIHNDQGGIASWFGTNTDIDDRKQVEETLRHSEERYRSVIETAAEGIVLQYADESITTYNRAAERILGLTSEQMKGSLFIDAIHENGSLFEPEAYPARVTLRTGQPLSNVVMGIHKSDGSLVWISVNTRPLFRNQETQPYAVVSSVFDITEQKQTEEELRLSDEVLQQMPDAILLMDLEGKIQKWMGKSAQIFGYTAEEAIGKPVNFLHRPDTRAGITAKMLQEVQETGTFVAEVSCLRKDGLEVPIETTAKTFYDDVGNPIFLIGIHRDITEQKRSQEALQEANRKLTSWVGELQQRNREIVLLGEMSDMLQACLTVEEAYNAITTLVPPLFPDISGGLFVINQSKNLVEAVATWGNKLASTKMFTPNECWALRRGRLHLVEDTDSSLYCKHLHHQPLPTESLCIPMMAQGEALGLLYLSAQKWGRLTEAKQQLAVTVAEHIGLSLANLKLRETLQNQSIRDPLTGLFNRRYMEESMTREIHRLARKQETMGIIMVDVDHFKRFNDTYGHEAGDTVLREVSLFLQRYIREADIVCRYGGEEFMLILPETSLAVTAERAEQLREGIKHLHLQYRHQSLSSLTLSVGVACFPEHGLSGELVIHAADTALYQAKAAGRDRVITAS